LMKDDRGIVQFWNVSPSGGAPVQVTHNPFPIASTFGWSPDGRYVAYAMDNSVHLTEISTGQTRRLTDRTDDALAPKSEACVFSPDGQNIAFMRQVPDASGRPSQIFVVSAR
jgi:Tol biopolymer transport system component